MAKVIKINENDIEGLVRKIMMQEGAEGYLDLEFTRLVDTISDNNKVKKVTDKFNSLTSIEAKKKLIVQLKKLVMSKEKKKPLKENDMPRGGSVYGGKAEIIDEVINRINEYGEEYISQLNQLNSGYPVTKYKKIEPPSYGKVDLPPGVKVKSTVYPK